MLLGHTLWLLDWVEELRSMASDAPAPHASARLVPYSAMAWLGLPCLLVNRAELPLQPALWAFVVDPARIGVALDALSGLVDSSPCSLSVARSRLKMAASAARRGDPTPFTVMGAEWYATQRPGGTDRPVEPPAASNLLIEQVLDSEGSLEPLAHLEPVLAPRVNVADRGAGGGFDKLIKTLGAYAFAHLPASLRGAVAPADLALEWGRLIALAVPDAMLACYETGLAGLVAVAERLPAATGQVAPAAVLSTTSLARALEHTPTFAAMLVNGLDVPYSERVRGVQQIDRALGNDGKVDLARLITDEDAISYLLPRLNTDDAERLDAAARVRLVCEELRVAREARDAAGGTRGGTFDADSGADDRGALGRGG